MPLYVYPLGGVISSLSAINTIPVTTETVVLTAAIPANAVAVGTTFRILANGVTTAANACTFRIRIGTTGTVSDTQAWISKSLTGAAGDRVWFEGTVITRTLGTPGAVYCEGRSYAVATFVTGTVVAAATVAATTTNPWFITLTLAATVGTTPIQTATIEAI